MALRFHLPDGEITDMVMISAPVFGLRDPANFVTLVESRRPDPATGRPDPAKVQAFNDAHPDTKAQIEYFKTAPVPASYAHAPFWAINTFVFVGEDGRRQPARWVVEPVAGVVGLTDEQLKTMPDEFLAAGSQGLKGQRSDRSPDDRALKQAERKIGQLTMENEVLRAAAEKRGLQIPPAKRPR